jgi:Cytosol aminopeptidase family, N-terminal domain
MRVSVKVVVLAVACATGYAILGSSGRPTPHQQTAAGAKVSAATQATSGTAGRDVARRSPRTPQGLPASRVATKPGNATMTLAVTGWMITAVGDSVMLAAAPELQAALPGIYIDAAASRQMNAGLAEVRMIAAAGGLRRVVLVGLGANGTVTASQINRLRAVIGPDRWLVLVNTYTARPWEQAVNAAIAKAARRDPRVLMVDWFSAIENHTNLLRLDQVRPRPSGGSLYARVVKAVVETAS